ncbi:MAG: hypothetical protein U1A78_04345 [Polyangia bacterium]
MRGPSFASSVRSSSVSRLACLFRLALGSQPAPGRWSSAAAVLVVAVTLVVTAGGCSRKIGDGCTSNVECSPLGDRFCDLASPGGYCTIEGCDIDTCPDSAACIRFFSLKKGQARCYVGRAARIDCPAGSETCCRPGSADCCDVGELCLCDSADCTAQQSSGPQGYCASESSERRWCMRGCGDDSDCRDGYSCIPTGAAGSISVETRMSDGTISQTMLRYCAPRR